LPGGSRGLGDVYKRQEQNEKLIDILGGIVIGSSLTGVIGWLFTMNKQHQSPKI
jgi:hypothetical protein